MKKTFPLRTVLSVTTDRLLTVPESQNDNGIGQIYELLNWITQDNLHTHQLVRASKRAVPFLFKHFPDLIPVNGSLESLDKWIKADKTGTAQEGIKMWLTELKMMFPTIKETYDVPQLNDYQHQDPIKELIEMRESNDGIVVIKSVKNGPGKG